MWLPVEISAEVFSPLSPSMSHFRHRYLCSLTSDTNGTDTGFFFPLSFQGFPNEPAAEIALNTVKSWIEENPDKVGHARQNVRLKQYLVFYPFVGKVSYIYMTSRSLACCKSRKCINYRAWWRRSFLFTFPTHPTSKCVVCMHIQLKASWRLIGL